MLSVKIEIGNSYSRIIGLTSEQLRKLKKVLSYQTDPKAVYYSGGYNRTKYLIDARGNFPTGLWAKVHAFLLENNISYTKTANYAIPVSKDRLFKLSLKDKPYEWQLEALEEAVRLGRGGIVAATGTGKSLLIALIASRFNVKTLVVVPTLEIKKQLSASLIELFGANKNIVVENIDSALLPHDKSYDLLIIDECHHSASKTYQKLNKHSWNGIHHRFFLTATFFRNQEHENLLFEAICGQIIYKLSIKDAIAKKYIVPVEAYYYDLKKQPTEAYTWAQVYNELVVNNHSRNHLIGDLLTRLKSQNVSTLCLVKEIAHGAILSDLTGIPFANGQDEDTRVHIKEFNSGRIKSLIGTTGILGEGIDTKPAEFIVIAGLGKAKSAFLQQVGRAVRNYPGKESAKIILFRDTSHRFTLRHYREQTKILKEELGIVPIKLEE